MVSLSKKIVGILIGVMIFCVGNYYDVNAKESEKSYYELEKPQELFIVPTYEGGYVTSIDYGFEYDDDIVKLSGLYDKHGKLFDIAIITEYAINDKLAMQKVSFGIDGDYRYLCNLFIDSLFYLYPGVDPYDPADISLLAIKDALECKQYADGSEFWYFDEINNYISVRACYQITNTVTGSTSYSSWSDYAYFGKGYPKFDEEVPKLDFEPQFKDVVLRYTTDIYGEVYPYLITYVEQPETANLYNSNSSGMLYLRYEILNKDGMFETVANMPYKYMLDSGMVHLYYPCDTIEIPEYYDVSNITLRVRYEWFENNTYPFCDSPVSTSSWSYCAFIRNGEVI